MKHHSTPAPQKSQERRRLLALLGVCAASLVAACGKQGPLRLPEPPAPAETSEEAE